MVFTVDGWLFLAIYWVILVITIFAFVNSLLYSAEAYLAADKLTKPTWCTILGFAVVLQFVPIHLPLIGIVLLVAALVYLADVRPALAGLYRR